MVYKARATCPADTCWGSPATSLLPVRLWVPSWTRNSGFGYMGWGECHGQRETCDDDQQWRLCLQHLHGARCASGTVTRSGHRDTSYFMFSFEMHCVGRTHAITLPRARKETALAHSWGITTQQSCWCFSLSHKAAALFKNLFLKLHWPLAGFGTENHVAWVQAAALRPTAPRNKNLHSNNTTNTMFQKCSTWKNIFLASLTWESTLKESINYSIHSAPNIINETQTR